MVGSLVVAFLFILYSSPIKSGGKEYKYKGQPKWAWQQKQYKKTNKKIYVTCRLAKRKIVMTQKICIYTGANNTTETIFVDKWEICPNQMQCIYEPNKTVPMIEQMMKSLEETLKKSPK